MFAVSNGLRKVIERLALSLSILSAICMATIVGLITLSIAMRKLASSPLHITEELVGLLLSVSLFLCLPLITLKSSHIRVSLVLDIASPALRRVLVILGAIFAVTFFGWVTYDSIGWIEFAHRLNLKTEATRLLLYPWMLVVPLTMGLTGVIFVMRLIGALEMPDLSPSDSSAIESGGR